MRHTASLLFCAGSLVVWPVGGADGQVIGGRALTPFFSAARESRLDIGLIGDSNGLHHAAGWDHGVTMACDERFGLYATGVHTAGEGEGFGAGVGFRCNTTSSRSSSLSPFAYTDGPACVAEVLSPHLLPAGYLYLAPEAPPVSNNSNQGMILDAQSPLGVNRALRFHYSYALFDTANPGVFTPCVRLNASPYTVLTPPLTISTGGGCDVRSGSLDIPAGERNMPLAFRYGKPTDRDNPDIRGPFMGLTMRIERPDLSHGVSCHTFFARGGFSARDMAQHIVATPDRTLAFLLGQMRELQPGGKRAVIRIDSGLNDRTETEPSVRGRLLPGNGGPAFRDNIEAIMDRIVGVWRDQGWDEGSLAFVLTVSHPIATPDDAWLLEYREQADLIASERSNVSTFRWDLVTGEEEMTRNGWYISPTDHYHLSTAGYEHLARRQLAALVNAACLADFNQDGGVDGVDLEAFFDAWERGGMEADANADGGIDGPDVAAFFADWERGSC